MPDDVTLIRDDKNKTITISMGGVVRTMSIGEWSKLISKPKKL